MGVVDRLRNKVEPFAALFWALGIVLANNRPCPPSRHHSTVGWSDLALFAIFEKLHVFANQVYF